MHYKNRMIGKRGEKMNKIDLIKGTISAFMGMLTGVFGFLAVPMVLLVVCNLFDYATGILASKYRQQKIESYKGMKGITKKIGMWLLVIVGAIMDALLKYSVTQLGVSVPFTFMIAAVVAIWIICNELISILENLKDMDVPLPDFLMKLTANIKSQMELKVDVMHIEGEGNDKTSRL